MALFSADLGKRIKRAVQKADHTIGRTEKSEVLTDDVQAKERLIELIKQSFQGTLKRFQACLPPTAEPEKRLRKIPESVLSSTSIESASQLNQSPVFSKVFSCFGEAEQSLADALLHFAIEVEKSVLQPIVTVIDKDIPSIQKLRKQLTNMALDMNSAKKSLSALQKQAQVPPGKIDSAREELEAEEVKVDQCRDQLLTEIYQFFSHEEKLCKLLLLALQLQADYHRQALSSLDLQISQMSEEIEHNSVKPVYGCDLSEHLVCTKQEIATVVEVCIQSIQKLGLDAEGLFRIAPSASKLRKLTAAFDANSVDDDIEDVDVHCLAGALKLYLRELPNPLMTFELYNDWSDASQREGSEKINALLAVVKKLPKANYDNLRYLIRFLYDITKYSDVNKMSATNLTIVIAPNLLYPSKAEQGSMQVAGVAMSVVEPLISHCELFFPADDTASQILSHSSQLEDSKANAATTAVDSKLSPNQRIKKVLGEKPKKQLAPVPPLSKQRSESAPNYGNISNTIDVIPESANAVSNSENLPKCDDKVTPPPKKMAKSASTEYIDNERNDSLEENVGDALSARVPVVTAGNEICKEGSPLTAHKKLQRSKALENAQSDRENRPSDDEASNEVFAPVDQSPESNSKTPSPRLRFLRKNSYSAPTGDPAVETKQKPAEKDSPESGSTATAGKQNSKDTAKPSIIQHLRKSSISEVMTSSSAFVNFNKNGNLNIKSKTLPADKVTLRQIRFTSQDFEEEDCRPCVTEAAEGKQKPRPKVPPRSPQRDKKVPNDDTPRTYPLEDTHL